MSYENGNNIILSSSFVKKQTNKQWPHTNIKALGILRSSTETAAAKTFLKSGFSYKNPDHGLHRGSCATGVWKNKQKTGHTQTLRHLKSGAQQYMKIHANTEKAAAFYLVFHTKILIMVYTEGPVLPRIWKHIQGKRCVLKNKATKKHTHIKNKNVLSNADPWQWDCVIHS